MYKYEIIIYWSNEDEAFIAEVPELPGCLAHGSALDEALKITNASVAQELGGLPPNKMHCSNLGADALHKAIENYKQKQGGAK